MVLQPAVKRAAQPPKKGGKNVHISLEGHDHFDIGHHVTDVSMCCVFDSVHDEMSQALTEEAFFRHLRREAV